MDTEIMLEYKAARGMEDIYQLTRIRKDGGRFPAIVPGQRMRSRLFDARGHGWSGKVNFH